MFTKKLEDQFSADLLNTVKGILDEAKKCPKDCECEKCEKEEDEEDDEDEMKEGFASAAQRKAVWATYADGGKGHPDNKKKKMKKEEVELEEGENLTGLPKSTAEKNKQYIEVTHTSGNKKRVPVHPTNAYKALNRYRNDPTTKSARIVSEEAEQIDELSKTTLGSYVKKAAGQAAGAAAGIAAIASSSAGKAPEKSKRNLRNRLTGISKATDKLTKEDQDFIDSLNNEMWEEIAIAEGRGRPPKEGTAAWHARQKQADDDMVALGMQLRKAKSMNKKVRFMDGNEHHVLPHHADRFEDHMAARKTSQEKAAFQKQAHKSHADFVKAVSAPVPKASKDTGEIVKYRH